MPSKNNKTLGSKVSPEIYQELSKRLENTGVSKSQFIEIALSMALKNAAMYEEIEFPLKEKRQVYVGDKLIMETGGAMEPGQFLYGLTYLTDVKGEK